MRQLVTLASALLLVLMVVALAPLAPADCHVNLRLVDSESGRIVPGVIRVRTANQDVVRPAELTCRGWGLDRAAEISQWFVVPGPVTCKLPRARVVLEAISGVESHRIVTEINLSECNERTIELPVRSISQVSRSGWFAANTHLHLRALSKEESDRYLREIPAADRLDLLFISYLERAGDDREYITNRYPIGDLSGLGSPGVLLSNGEEHRHNFGPQGEGYGHVMLLGIQKLVQPVSIGFGISKKHPDSPGIRAGIDDAHAQGGTAIWCHNNWGYEDVPNWLAGRLDAQNIFDGGSHGGYADSFYRYLNAGLRVPFSTGTDWFQYDFSRVYARVDGELTTARWLDALRAGRTFITNGPIIEFRVNEREVGDTIALDQPGEVVVRATARGRLDFGRLEIVQNGQTIESSPTRGTPDGYEAQIAVNRSVAEPCWLAARVTTSAKNEYGQPLFAHSSPIYVTVHDRHVRIRDDVRFLLGELQSARSVIADKAQFDDDAQRAKILGQYDEAIAKLQAQLAP